MKKVIVCSLAFWFLGSILGCVKTTRVVMDKEGVVEETTTWEPVVYEGSAVVHVEPTAVVYGRPVYYSRSYYRPPVVVRGYPRYYSPRFIHVSRPYSRPMHVVRRGSGGVHRHPKRYR